MKEDQKRPPGEVLSYWLGKGGCDSIEPLSQGGFSGSRLWRVEIEGRPLILRRWPRPGPTSEHVGWIHRVLLRAQAEGFDRIAAPFHSIEKQTVHELFGFIWDLSPWLPGAAVGPEAATSKQVRRALESLGLLHQAMYRVTTDVTWGNPPGIANRRREIRRWREERFAKSSSVLLRSVWPAGFEVSQRYLELAAKACEPVDQELSRCELVRVPLQPCLRDVWWEHILFVGDEVTGIIDYGATRIDNVACDVARLLGSFAGDDRARWQAGLKAYQSIRQLSDDELQLIGAYDRSTVVLAGLNWILWIFFERRQFHDLPTILARLSHYLDRLERLAR